MSGWNDSVITNRSWEVPVQPLSLLIRSEEHGNILVDPRGDIGTMVRTLGYSAILNEYGLTRAQINYVILTHLDASLLSGITHRTNSGLLNPNFPDARILVQRKALDAFLEKAGMEFPHYQFARPDDLRFGSTETHLAAVKDNFSFLDGDATKFGLELKVTGGHIAGFQTVTLPGSDPPVTYAGELAPTFAHLQGIRFVSSYDFLPDETLKQKKILLKAALQYGYAIVPAYAIPQHAIKPGSLISRLEGSLGASVSGQAPDYVLLPAIRPKMLAAALA